MAKAAPAVAAKKTAARAPSKSELFASIAESTGLTKKDVGAVFDALNEELKKSMSSKGTGVFQLPGLLKVSKKKVPARAAAKGIPNPFKPGELMDRAAKPAFNKIVVRALKSLKDMA